MVGWMVGWMYSVAVSSLPLEYRNIEPRVFYVQISRQIHLAALYSVGNDKKCWAEH